LPSFPPEEGSWQKAMTRARSFDGLTEIHLRGFLRGPAVRLVERIVEDGAAARDFLEATDTGGHPGRLIDEVRRGLERSSWLCEGGGCRFLTSRHRIDPREEARGIIERIDAEASGCRDALFSIAPVEGTLGFDALTRVTGHDRAALWYIVEHSLEEGYLRRDRSGRYHFTSEAAARTLAARLSEPKRLGLLRKAHDEIKNIVREHDSSSGLLLRCARIERGASHLQRAYRCFLAAALKARQEYRKDLFLEAVDEARTIQREVAAGTVALARAFGQVEEEILGTGAKGRVALERLRSLPIEVSLKVADFGIARRAGSVPGEDGLPWGTPRYMSPEQARKDPLTPASDLYSLGILARELVEGRHPLGTLKGKAAIAAIIAGEIDTPARDEGSRSLLETLIDRMLDPAPDRRPGAEELAGALQRIQTGRGEFP